MSSRPEGAVPAVRSIIYLGLDVHKDSIHHRGAASGGEGPVATGSAGERPAEAEAMARTRGTGRRDPRLL